MFHKFSTEQIDSCREKVFIDGNSIRCTGYTLTHQVDTVPILEIEMPILPEIKDQYVVVQISNKEEIARLMDKTEFEEFCRMWNEVQNEQEERNYFERCYDYESNCNLTTCRYNKNGKCTNKEKKKECVEVSRKVLCKDD